MVVILGWQMEVLGTSQAVNEDDKVGNESVFSFVVEQDRGI